MKSFGKLFLSASIVFLAGQAPVHAESYDLITLYKSAIDYDADTAAAKAAYQADQQGEDIALAGLLPNLSASAQSGRIDNEVKSGPATLKSDSYKSTSYGLSLSQPLFSMPEWYSLSSAEFNSSRAEAVYLSAQQSLILNVAEAYFNVLRAQEDLTASRALETAVKRQYEQAKEQFEVGLIAITDVHEANASFDSSKTTRIRAEGALTIATESLSRITGSYATELDTLSKDYPIKIDPASEIQSWVNASQESNLDIAIAKFTQKSLEADYKAKRSGHYPTLTLNAGYQDSEFENYKPSDSETEQTNVYLNFNLPLYSGGGTQARARQARYLLEQAKHRLSSAQRAAEITTRTEYINIKTNVQTVESLQQNIVSRQSALEATKEGYNVGTRNIVEVLDAERNYFTALRDYAHARFDFVISSLKIKQAAGLLHERDLLEINKFLFGRTK